MTVKRLAIGLLGLALVGVLAAAPVPKDRVEDLGPITDDQLTTASNNLKQIGIALHAYHHTYGSMPNNITDKAGKPLLSWRVAILPFIEEDALYKQFKLDEPWDSEANKKLIEKLPKTYAPVRAKTKEKGMTFLQGFDGTDTTFEAGKKLRIPASFPDGTSNTIAVVEAGNLVVWSKPEDVKFDATKPLPSLGRQFDGDFHLVCIDGATYKAVGKSVNADEFKKMITKADGQVINMDAALGHK